ncbi:MAG: serine hydrolase domain-containing protein [Calditrichia bacterium]
MLRRPLLYLHAFILLTLQFCLAQSHESQIQALLDSTLAANPQAVGIMVHVEAPDLQLSFSSAAGNVKKDSNLRLKPLQPVLIASNTKTVVAAAILRLAEMKKLQLDEAIAPFLHKKTSAALLARGYPLESITLIHLLSHTSGITDYVNDAYFDSVDTQPQKQWTRDEQIELAITVTDTLVEPGKTFSYGDINYLLLTEVIETCTGKPFWKVIPELLNFSANNINAMWFVNLEEAPADALPLAHQYWETRGWDSYNLNPSWDLHGGGGQAATTKDLAVFFQQLFTEQIVRDSVLLKRMYTLVLPKSKSIYCLGLRKISFDGYEAYYHGGFWGTDAMYLPKLNMTIAAFTLEKDQRNHNADLSKRIIKLLTKP